MAKLLKHNKSDSLDTVDVEIQEITERQDIIGLHGTVTFDQNIRVDNHLRNRLQAIRKLRRKRSAKDVVEMLIEEHENTMSSAEMMKYRQIVMAAEQNDFITHSDEWRQPKVLLNNTKIVLTNTIDRCTI